MKLLYIHIPKTGGTSITEAISQYKDAIITEQHPVYKKNPKHNKNYLSVLNFRVSRAEHFREVLGEVPYSKLWKIAIVRNPWDRYVSNWKWLAQRTGQRTKWKDRGWKGEDGKVSFESFVKQMSWCYKESPSLHGYQHDKWHIRNQIEHLTDSNNNIIIDYVGKFENLQQEFDLICRKANLDLQLPHLNRVGHYSGEEKKHEPIRIHYSKYYNQELIDIVAERCRADIEEFGYDYENQR